MRYMEKSIYKNILRLYLESDIEGRVGFATKQKVRGLIPVLVLVDIDSLLLPLS